MSDDQNRKLATILFADIIEEEETHTFQILKCSQTLLESAAQKFNG